MSGRATLLLRVPTKPRNLKGMTGKRVDKSAPKSAPKTATGVPFQKGGDPRQGRGPAPGAPNAGRPPDEWKARLRAMASRDEVLAHVETVLMDGPAHPFFDRALQYVTDHGYGRATQPIEHSGNVVLLSADERDARIRALLARRDVP